MSPLRMELMLFESGGHNAQTQAVNSCARRLGLTPERARERLGEVVRLSRAIEAAQRDLPYVIEGEV